MFEYLQIETTTFCNARCWYCHNSQTFSETMDDGMFYGIIESTRGMNIIYRPYGLGEPLTDSRLPLFCKFIKEDPTAKVELHTNGELLTEKVAKQLIEYVDVVRFSIDGWNETTIFKNKRIDRNTVYANTKSFLKMASDIDIQVRMINLPGTEDEQLQFCDYWNDIRQGIAVITPLYTHPWENQKEPLNLPCIKMYNEAFIYSKGSVHLCPWDYGNRNIVGDVRYDTIVNIWNSPLYTKYREILANGERNKIELCSKCNAVFPEGYKVKTWQQVRNR